MILSGLLIVAKVACATNQTSEQNFAGRSLVHETLVRSDELWLDTRKAPSRANALLITCYQPLLPCLEQVGLIKFENPEDLEV